MFTVMHRFPVRRGSEETFKSISAQAAEILKRYDFTPLRLIRDLDDEHVEFCEMMFCDSKELYGARIEEVERDPNMVELYLQLIALVPESDIERLHYETYGHEAQEKPTASH